jgi:hypothetical protein
MGIDLEVKVLLVSWSQRAKRSEALSVAPSFGDYKAGRTVVGRCE